MTMNVGEYGLAVNVLLSYDVSAATVLGATVTRPDGTTYSATPTIGQVDLVTPDQGTFPAHQYVVYSVKQGDLTVPGDYLVRVTYIDGTKRLFSDPTSFPVSP